MPALPEYLTRTLLENHGVPLVSGSFVSSDDPIPTEFPKPPVFLKAQIPGATSRKKQGLVRRIDNASQLTSNLIELLLPGNWGQADGVLITRGLNLQDEYYAGCMLDFGSDERLPGGMLLFSSQGGSGVEDRSTTLLTIPFSLLNPPDVTHISTEISKMADLPHPDSIASFLEGMITTFIEYRLTVLEINPIGVLEDGSLIAVDCRAEFERSAVRKRDGHLFYPPGKDISDDLTRLEKAVSLVNTADPSGTGFFRENRKSPPKGALRVATNLCGGGGKMLWEMTTGSRIDIHSMNESDTSGGLSAFKSYRILRIILAQKDAQVLLLTGSGMAFQNQHHLAAAVWKALRESPTPLPSLLRFGGTDEEKARELFERVSGDLPVSVRTYPPEIFPNAMVDDIRSVALDEGVIPLVELRDPPEGEPVITVEVPPGKIYFYPEKWESEEVPPSIAACPAGYLRWDEGRLTADPEAKCIGCLMCETASLLDGRGELRIHLEMPMEVD